MPASGSSFLISTAVYLLSCSVFTGLAYSPVHQAVQAAERTAVRRAADGLKTQLDSLDSGSTLLVDTKTLPLQIPVSFSVEGHLISASFGHTVETRLVRLNLPSATLSPGTTYLISVHGEDVTVEEKSLG